MATKKTMTTKEASVVYGMSMDRLRRLIQLGELPATKVHRDNYIPIAALDRMFGVTQ